MNISNAILWKFGSGTCDFMVKGGKLIWEDKNISKPTDSELELWETEYKSSYPLQELREKRTQLLAETDYMGNSDVTLSDAWKTYRQALRDITDTKPSVNHLTQMVTNITWPTHEYVTDEIFKISGPFLVELVE